ncbi:hypothetical protein FVE85_8123 [Porphyridium purpureum]|uniref:Uncharacterized protein n=1 Tax=Porphyridium purpureum TaxID=35688 RepID=A0A5J4YMK5_PORPP|nr:hypothetical protein FVE85_8123 [Porphyridium purpureum]|eukprot:POR7088..scf295_9
MRKEMRGGTSGGAPVRGAFLWTWMVLCVVVVVVILRAHAAEAVRLNVMVVQADGAPGQTASRGNASGAEQNDPSGGLVDDELRSPSMGALVSNVFRDVLSLHDIMERMFAASEASFRNALKQHYIPMRGIERFSFFHPLGPVFQGWDDASTGPDVRRAFRLSQEQDGQKLVARMSLPELGQLGEKELRSREVSASARAGMLNVQVKLETTDGQHLNIIRSESIGYELDGLPLDTDIDLRTGDVIISASLNGRTDQAGAGDSKAASVDHTLVDSFPAQRHRAHPYRVLIILSAVVVLLAVSVVFIYRHFGVAGLAESSAVHSPAHSRPAAKGKQL